MSFALSIKDKTSSGEVVSSNVLKFPVESVSVKELIETRVAQEIENQREENRPSFINLILPNSDEESLNGTRRRQNKKANVDVAEQQSIAIEAFSNCGFFLLVNDVQLTDLDDVIQITPKSEVVFYKLIPIVGG